MNMENENNIIIKYKLARKKADNGEVGIAMDEYLNIWMLMERNDVSLMKMKFSFLLSRICEIIQGDFGAFKAEQRHVDMIRQRVLPEIAEAVEKNDSQRLVSRGETLSRWLAEQR